MTTVGLIVLVLIMTFYGRIRYWGRNPKSGTRYAELRHGGTIKFPRRDGVFTIEFCMRK